MEDRNGHTIRFPLPIVSRLTGQEEITMLIDFSGAAQHPSYLLRLDGFYRRTEMKMPLHPYAGYGPKKTSLLEAM